MQSTENRWPNERIELLSNDLYNEIQQAVAAIQARVGDFKPEFAIILGSGLGPLADEVENPQRISYADVPHWPQSTVMGHSGELVLGTLEGKKVAVMKGRVHFYEGYSLQRITFGVRVLHALGAHTLIVSNASGGVRSDLVPGDLMILTDHINLMGSNPLIGPNDERLGLRFPPMSRAYDADLRELTHKVASAQGFRPKEGVYLGLTGPSFETPAEIRFFGLIGADAVGMSTVPEVIVARHEDMRVLGISCVTNVLHSGPSEDSHQDVLNTAKEAGPRFVSLVKGVVKAS